MLATTDRAVVDRSATAERLQVELPEAYQSFFEENGYLPPTANESRRNARMAFRRIAKVEFYPAANALQFAIEQHSTNSTILIKDLSRTGMGVMFHRQLYPTQRMKIRCKNYDIEATVVRCRRIADKCFEVGLRILESK